MERSHDVFIYSASMVGEISDRIVEIDRAMRWGYGHKLGPFELWDALGFETTHRMHCEAKFAMPDRCPADARRKAHVGFYRSCRPSRISAYRVLRPGPTMLRPTGERAGHRVSQEIKRRAGSSKRIRALRW